MCCCWRWKGRTRERKPSSLGHCCRASLAAADKLRRERELEEEKNPKRRNWDRRCRHGVELLTSPGPPSELPPLRSSFLSLCELLWLMRKWFGVKVVAAKVTGREEGVLTRCVAFEFRLFEETDDETHEEFYYNLLIRCCFSYYLFIPRHQYYIL
ncbi:uncharacterized protein DS421_3g77930 [Arachis hypogaea]|nr:uncharacterized protein DS421_3g77930 [Arachis hypogaea]